MIINKSVHKQIMDKDVSPLPAGVYIKEISKEMFSIVNFDDKPCDLKGVLDSDAEVAKSLKLMEDIDEPTALPPVLTAPLATATPDPVKPVK